MKLFWLIPPTIVVILPLAIAYALLRRSIWLGVGIVLFIICGSAYVLMGDL